MYPVVYQIFLFHPPSLSELQKDHARVLDRIKNVVEVHNFTVNLMHVLNFSMTFEEESTTAL